MAVEAAGDPAASHRKTAAEPVIGHRKAVDDPAAGRRRRRWYVLAVVLTAEVMDILDTTTVNVAGPSVRRSIGGGIGLVQWLSASYTLALAVLLITGGRLGDRYGPRRMFLAYGGMSWSWC
jgi:MFS family permease